MQKRGEWAVPQASIYKVLILMVLPLEGATHTSGFYRQELQKAGREAESAPNPAQEIPAFYPPEDSSVF